MRKSGVLLVVALLFIFGGCGNTQIPEESATAQVVEVNTGAVVISPTVNTQPATDTASVQLSEENTEQKTVAVYESTTLVSESLSAFAGEITTGVAAETAFVEEEITTDFMPEITDSSAESTSEDVLTSFVEIATEGESVTSQESITTESNVTEENGTVQEAVPATTVTEAFETVRAEETTAVQQSSGEVELSISMPEKNGTMMTDKDSDNKFIRIVNKEKGIDAGLLLAVYSVPESGQNYVFEFYDAEDFSAEKIRRVYLIDSFGDITSVAAAESSEKENISPVENWFCMNVLIKEIIYPAVTEDAE